MESFLFDHHFQGFENGDLLIPEAFGAGDAQPGSYLGWASLDPSLDSVRQNYHYNPFGFQRTSQNNPRYFTSYDEPAHGFTLELGQKQADAHLYQLGLDTEWHGDVDYHRHHRYLSPSSSGAGMSFSDSSMSDHALSPDIPRCEPFFAHQDLCPHPPADTFRDAWSSGNFQHPSYTVQAGSNIIPSQSPLSMKDFLFGPDTAVENTCPEEAETVIVNIQPPDDLEMAENPSPDDSGMDRSLEDQVSDDEDEPTMKAESENDSDFTPTRSSRHTATTPLRTSLRSPRTTKTTPHAVQDPHTRIYKPASKSKSKSKAGRKPNVLNNASAKKHFPCPFAAFGCNSVFPCKNEWKRHTASQHLQLGFYRCDLGSCSPDHPSQLTQTRGHNDFNRKDLFTQHCRRMHWDECDDLKESKVKGREWSAWSSKEKEKFETFMEDVRERCWMQKRTPPRETTCGVCRKFFTDNNEDEAGSAWDQRMEHVGKHYERGERDVGEDVDDGLREWCLENDLTVNMGGSEYLKGCEPENEKGGKGKRRSGKREGLRQQEGTDVEEVVAQQAGEKAVRQGEEDDTDAEGEIE